MKKTIISITATLSALFLLVLAYLSCGGGNTPPAPVAVTGLTLNRTAMTLAAGKEPGTLFPVISPHNATNRNVTWDSDRKNIATVSANGVVTPLAEGTATVTAKSQDSGKIIAECSIEVVAAPIPARGAYLSKNDLYITEGGFGALALNFIPSRATNQNVTWESDNPAVAAVDPKSGLVTARGKGTANISATFEAPVTPATGMMYEGSNNVQAAPTAKRSAMLTVGAKSDGAAVTRIDMYPPSLDISVGGTGILNPTVLPANAANANVSFSSNAPDVASVSSLGLVTGRSAGRAVIGATTEDGGFLDVCIVNVTDNKVNPTGVSLNKTMELGDIGKTEQLTATVSPSNATDKSLYWYSSDESIVSVDMNGIVQARKTGTAVVTAETQVGGRTATCSVTVTGASVPVTGVTLNKTTASISIGGTETLVATVAPSNATNKNVTWTSSSNATATVSDGTVTGVAAGTATITATTVDGKKTATCAVTVTNTVAVTGVTVAPTSASIAVGGTQTLTATVAPSTATNKKVTWSSSDSTIASVNQTTATETPCTVKGEKIGTATITATTEDGSKTATCTVTVSGVSVTGVTVAPTSVPSLPVGSTQTLTATVAPTTATNKKVTWSSSDSTVASVNQTTATETPCTVTGVKVGTATITATTEDGSKTATCTVTVITAVSVTGVTLDKPAATILVGDTQTLTATVAPNTATNKKVTWSSSDSTIASVNQTTATETPCTVTGVKVGTATITAKTEDGNKTATCAVTVTNNNVSVTGVTLDPTTAVISKNGTIKLTHTITPATPQTQTSPGKPTIPASPQSAMAQ